MSLSAIHRLRCRSTPPPKSVNAGCSSPARQGPRSAASLASYLDFMWTSRENRAGAGLRGRSDSLTCRGTQEQSKARPDLAQDSRFECGDVLAQARRGDGSEAEAVDLFLLHDAQVLPPRVAVRMQLRVHQPHTLVRVPTHARTHTHAQTHKHARARTHTHTPSAFLSRQS